MIRGADFSHWNSPDFPALFNDGFRFVWLKATEGTTWPDPKYAQFKPLAIDAGLEVGSYHYFRAAWSGKKQAENFFSKAGGQDLLPPAIDVERRNNTGFSQSVFRARLQECLDRCEDLFGRKPAIYTSRSAWAELVGSLPGASQYPLWVAHYTMAADPLLPVDWSEWAAWQHTSTPFDQNRMTQAFWDNLGGSEPPPPSDLELRVQLLEQEVAALSSWADSYVS